MSTQASNSLSRKNFEYANVSNRLNEISLMTAAEEMTNQIRKNMVLSNMLLEIQQANFLLKREIVKLNTNVKILTTNLEKSTISLREIQIQLSHTKKAAATELQKKDEEISQLKTELALQIRMVKSLKEKIQHSQIEFILSNNSSNHNTKLTRLADINKRFHQAHEQLSVVEATHQEHQQTQEEQFTKVQEENRTLKATIRRLLVESQIAETETNRFKTLYKEATNALDMAIADHQISKITLPNIQNRLNRAEQSLSCAHQEIANLKEQNAKLYEQSRTYKDTNPNVSLCRPNNKSHTSSSPVFHLPFFFFQPLSNEPR